MALFNSMVSELLGGFSEFIADEHGLNVSDVKNTIIKYLNQGTQTTMVPLKLPTSDLLHASTVTSKKPIKSAYTEELVSTCQFETKDSEGNIKVCGIKIRNKVSSFCSKHIDTKKIIEENNLEVIKHDKLDCWIIKHTKLIVEGPTKPITVIGRIFKNKICDINITTKKKAKDLGLQIKN